MNAARSAPRRGLSPRALAPLALGALLLGGSAPPLDGGAKAPASVHPPGAPAGLPKRKLIVGTNFAPPFSMKEQDGTWHGLSIDLWREIALRLGIEYEIREFPFSEVLEGLRTGKSDLVVAALTMTAEREKLFDFTHPFYSSGLGIAVPATSDAMSLFGRLLSWDFLKLLIIIFGALLGFGALVWLFERRRNEAQFGGKPSHGIAAGFWWSAVTLTSVGYGDKVPVTFWGRFVGVVWMFAGVVIVAGFTGAVASMLTVKHFEGTVKGADDLRRVRVSAPGGSSVAEYLKKRGINFRAYPTTLASIEAVAKGEVDAGVGDAPIFQYYALNQLQGKVRVLEKTFGRQDYAIALPNGSTLQEPLNREMLDLITGARWQNDLQRYIGQ